jgi:hypothetical protein
MLSWLSALLLIATCSACQAKHDPFERAVCGPPCWNGLTPGRSSDADAAAFLQRLPERERSTINDEPVAPGCRVLQWEEGRAGHRRYIYYTTEHTVMRIVVWLEGRYTLQDVVDRFGPPPYIEALRAEGPEAATYFLAVIYPSLGLRLDMDVPPDDLGQVRAGVSVKTISLSPPGDLDSYLQLSSACYPGTDGPNDPYVKELRRRLQPWQGSGKVETVIPH